VITCDALKQNTFSPTTFHSVSRDIEIILIVRVQVKDIVENVNRAGKGDVLSLEELFEAQGVSV
jgi:hypothetical protein